MRDVDIDPAIWGPTQDDLDKELENKNCFENRKKYTPDQKITLMILLFSKRTMLRGKAWKNELLVSSSPLSSRPESPQQLEKNT